MGESSQVEPGHQATGMAEIEGGIRGWLAMTQSTRRHDTNDNRFQYAPAPEGTSRDGRDVFEVVNVAGELRCRCRHRPNFGYVGGAVDCQITARCRYHNAPASMPATPHVVGRLKRWLARVAQCKTANRADLD